MRRTWRWWLGAVAWLAACGAAPDESTTANERAGAVEGDRPATGGTATPAPAGPSDPRDCGPDEGGALPCPPPPDARTAGARELFMNALRLFDQGDCNRALLLFREAYELVPRGALLFNVAQCQEQLGDLQGALQTYQHFLHASDEQLPENHRRTALERVQQLERQLGLR